MNTARLPFFLAVVLVLFATSASSQNYQNFQDDWTRIKTAPLSFGPFRIFPAFQIKNFGFDNNVYYENRAIHDFTATLSPEATVYLPFRSNAIFYFRYNPEYCYYFKEKQQRAFTNSYFAGLKLRFFQRFVLWADYSNRQYRQAVSVELARPTRDVQEAVALGLFFETARKTALGVSWRTVRYSYQDIELAGDVIGLSHVLNRHERTIAMEFYYQAWPGAFVFTNAGYSEYRFDQAALERDSQAAQLVAGIRFPILGKIQGMFSLGYRKLIPRNRDKTGFAGLYGDSEVTYRRGKFGLRIGFRRGDSFSYLETAYLFLGTRLSAGISYYLTNFIRLDYNYELGYADYQGRMNIADDSGNMIEIQRRDHQIFHVAGIVVRVYKNLGIGITYNSSRWRSNLPGWDRRRDSIGAFLTTQF
jgi:hypothetical protein